MNLLHPKSKAVHTPYGFFNSITDAAKYIFENDARLRNKNAGRHPYNTIINLRNMVTVRCRSNNYKDWSFDE